MDVWMDVPKHNTSKIYMHIEKQIKHTVDCRDMFQKTKDFYIQGLLVSGSEYACASMRTGKCMWMCAQEKGIHVASQLL